MSSARDASLDGRPAVSWYIAGGAALLLLLTYLYLVRFAYPVNDDWSFATTGRDAGVWQALATYWNDFGGRWSAGILLYGMGICGDALPSVYPLLIAVLAAALVSAGWPLLRCCGVDDPRRLWLGTMALAAIQFTALPVLEIGNLGAHAAMPETVYWVSGGVNYALAYPVIAWSAWLACRARLAWLGWSLAVGCGLVVSALSEMAGICAAAVGAALGCCGHRRGWALMAAAIAGLGIVALAPGNLKRLEILRDEVQADAGLAKLPQAALYAAWFTGMRLLSWLADPAVVVACGVAAWCGTATRAVASPRPRAQVLIVGGATLAAAWAMALPTFALVGFLEARHEGLVSLVAVAGMLLTACLAGRAWPDAVAAAWMRRVWLGWLGIAFLHICLLPSPIEPAGVDWLPPLGLCAGLACVAMGWRGAAVAGPALAIALFLQPSWWQALADAGGKAPALHARQMHRDAEVRRLVASGIDRVVLPWLGDPKRQPRTIRIYEVQDGWMLDVYLHYFRLREARFSDRIDGPLELVDRPAAAPAR